MDTITLPREDAEAYALGMFINKHVNQLKDFYNCEYNGQQILAYMQKHRIPKSIGGYEKAFSALQQAGALLTSVAARQTMSNEEYSRHLTWHGVEIYDPTFGNSLGKKWPEEVKEWDCVEKPSDIGRVGRAVGLPSDVVFPNAKRYRPSRSEYAMWSPEKLRVWCEQNGYTGNIPDDAFRD
jgi:hypothetical protein